MKKFIISLFVFALIGFIFRMILVFSGPLDHLGGRVDELFLVDDSYYCLNIARNIAQGNGWTHDGLNETSGFQPLYVFAMVPVFIAVDDNDKTTPVYVSLVMLSLFNVGAGIWLGLILYQITRRRWLAMIGTGIFMLSPYIIAVGINGMETSMALFFTGWILWYYLRHRAEMLKWQRIIPLGILLGIGFWARLDTAILAIVLGLDILNQAQKVQKPRAGLVAGAILAIISVGIYFPFMLGSYERTGSWIPESGRAVRQFSVAQKGLVDEQVYEYRLENLKKTTALGFLISPLLPDTRIALGLFPDYYLWPGRVWLFAGGVVFVFCLLFWWSRRKYGSSVPPIPEVITILIAYTMLMAMVYALFIFGDYFFYRYMYPTTWVGIIMAFVFISLIPSPATKGFILGLMVAIFIFNVTVELTAILERNQPQYWGRSQVVAKTRLESQGLIKPGDRVGAFQSGYFSYWNENPAIPVVNLDGVVNGRAYDAIREKQLMVYLRNNRIRFVVDWPSLYGLFTRAGMKPGDVIVDKYRDSSIAVMSLRPEKVAMFDY